MDTEFKFYGCKINSNKVGFGIIIWEHEQENKSILDQNYYSNSYFPNNQENKDNSSLFKEEKNPASIKQLANKNTKNRVLANIPGIPHTSRPSSKQYNNSFVNRKSSSSKVQTKLIGSFVKNKLEGFIIFEKSNGAKFQGELSSNVANGFGIYTNQYKMSYVGEWKEDCQNGTGIEYWPDGSKYHGQFNSGLKEGIGKYCWYDGSIYSGEWFANSMHGYGEYITSDKKVYRGQFYDSMMHGYGYLNINNGEKFYIGSFERDKKEGFGIFIWTNPIFKAFIGFWKNSKQDGIGKYITEKNSKITGTLESTVDDKKFGYKYGLWKNGERVSWMKNFEDAIENLDGNQIQFYNKLQTEAVDLISLIEKLKNDPYLAC